MNKPALQGSQSRERNGVRAGRSDDRFDLRIRLGVIVPSVNTVVEPWFSAIAGDEATLHASRMLLDNNLTADAIRRMDEEEGSRAAAQIASCRPAAVAYCCTASTVVQGLDYDKGLQARLTRQIGAPCFTAVAAVIEALRAVDARRIAIVSPYPDAIDRMEQDMFKRAAFDVVGSVSLGISDSFRLAAASPEELMRAARYCWKDAADTLLITCLNTKSHELIQQLEDEFGRPVITSTQATLWKLLRAAGVVGSINGYGRLLQLH